jgi:signal peptidase
MMALRYVAVTVLGALLVALAFLLTPLPELFGWQIYAVQTGSMEPSIPVGSLIAVQPVPAANLKVGDVITFSDRSRPDVRVTHRIVSLETKDGQRLAVTKGDANNTTDSWNVPISEAIGRVAFHVPGMGYVLAWLGSTTVKLVALALAGLMLVLPSLRRGLRRQGAERMQETSPERVVLPVRTAAQPSALAPDVPATRPAASSAAAIEPPAEDVAEVPDASFDALANEIDALLGRIANGEASSDRSARGTAPGRRA